MASLEVVPYSKIKNSNHLTVRNIILDALDSSNVSVIGLVDEYQASVKNISIPDRLGFLRVISDYHANTLLSTIRKF